MDRQTGPAYDRATMLFGDGTRLLSVVPDGAVGTGPNQIARPDRITNTRRPGGTGAAGRGALYDQTLTVYNQLASDSTAMAQYFALVYPAPDLTTSTPTAATPHAIDAAAARALLPRLQALPPAALNLVFDGTAPTPLDEASVAAALRPIIERDYDRLGGTSTNAGTPGDRPFATGGSPAQRAAARPAPRVHEHSRSRSSSRCAPRACAGAPATSAAPAATSSTSTTPARTRSRVAPEGPQEYGFPAVSTAPSPGRGKRAANLALVACPRTS